MTTPRTLHDTHCADWHCKYMQNTHKYIQINKHTLKYKTQKIILSHTLHFVLDSGVLRGVHILVQEKATHPWFRFAELFFRGKYFQYNRKSFQYRFGLSKGYMIPFSKEPVMASSYIYSCSMYVLRHWTIIFLPNISLEWKKDSYHINNERWPIFKK